MWAQHGQCMRDTHLLRHAPAIKKIYILKSLLRLFSATNTIPSVLPVCSLHVHIKIAITHRSLTLALHIIFSRAPANFTWAQARVCLGVATPLSVCVTKPPVKESTQVGYLW